MKQNCSSNMKKITETSEIGFCRRDILVALACVIFLVTNLGLIGSTGRRRAKEAVCLSNIREWGAIAEGHTQDNNGYFWASDPGTPCYWWIKYLEEEYKDWKRNRIWFCPEGGEPMIDEYGNYSPSLTIFNAWGIYTGSGLGPNGISGSYGLNGYVLTPRPLGGGATKYEGGVSVTNGWKTPYVAGADNVPVFLDSLRFDVWPRETEAPAASEHQAWTLSSMARCCINRHSGATNCLFMDWSARKVGLKELWKLKWHRQFNTDGPWTQAGGVRPTYWPAWIRSFKDY